MNYSRNFLFLFVSEDGNITGVTPEIKILVSLSLTMRKLSERVLQRSSSHITVVPVVKGAACKMQMTHLVRKIIKSQNTINST